MDSIVIIGAGAAGLTAARMLSKAGKTVTVVEARDRIGGKIFTAHEKDFSVPLETGAEFIHGDLPLTKRLAKEAGIALLKGKGESWNLKDGVVEENDVFEEGGNELMDKLNNLEHDMSIAEFLDTYFSEPEYDSLRESILRFVEGFDAAEPTKVSAFALREEWDDKDDDSLQGYRLDGGYSQLMHFLKQECMNRSVTFHLNTVVTEIQWAKHQVTVIAEGNEQFTADSVLITVPPAVLKTGRITFSPAIPEQLDAIQKIETGGVIKFLVEFTEAIWETESYTTFREFPDLHFLFTDATIPTWWTQRPLHVPFLTGWLSGHSALYASKTEEELKQDAIQSLAYIFGSSEEALKNKIVAIKIVNWITDPFARGAYAYKTVDTPQAVKFLAEPVEDTIYFAGEAYYEGTEMGTVEAALVSGEEKANVMLKHKYACCAMSNF